MTSSSPVRRCIQLSHRGGQRGITWKLRKREQPFLYATHHPDLIHIPIKLHEDILNCYRVMEHTIMFTDGLTDRQRHDIICPFFQNGRIKNGRCLGHGPISMLSMLHFDCFAQRKWSESSCKTDFFIKTQPILSAKSTKN